MKPILTKVQPRIAKMRKIIENAARARTLIEGELIYETDDFFTGAVCDNPSRCAMGELLFHMGISNKALKVLKTDGSWDQKIYQRLWNAYRIDANDVSKIILANDNNNIGPTNDAAEFANRGKQVSKALTKLSIRKMRVNPFLNQIENGKVIGHFD